jgi:hypothetical protein
MRTLLTVATILLAVTARAGTPLEDATVEDQTATALVHRTATAALVGDVGALDDAVADVDRLDQARGDQSLSRTGLADDIRLLAAAHRPTRDARLDALHALLDDDPDPVVTRVAHNAVEREDDAAAADQLLQDDRHNRRATVVNDAVRPLGVFSGAAFLAALNPFILAGSAVDSLATTAVNLYHYNDLSPREREALVRYRRQLSRDPDTAATPDILDAVREINARRNTALCADTVTAARKAFDDEDLDRAQFYVMSASALDGCDDRIAKTRERVAAALARREAETEAARWPADDLRLPTGEERDAYQGLAAATVLGDPARMMTAAQAFAQRYPDSDHHPAAVLTVGVARDLAGHREGAEEALQDIAGKKSGPGRIATAMLASPRFQRLDLITSAERRHGREVAEYVLVGGQVDGRTALYTATQFGAQGMQAAESFGVFNVIGMVTRAWSAWRKDPASNQAIIDQGEQFLAREPEAPEAAEVHERLATAYERAGASDRALLHYRAVANPDPKRLAALEEKVAERLLENARKGDGEPALLEVIVRYYPMTDAAEQARTALAALPRRGEVAISRDVLLAHPSLMGPSALDLAPALVDGKLENGELADAGVTVGAVGLSLKLRDPDGGADRTETRPLGPEQCARARAAAEDALYASALAKDPNAGEMGRFERFIPFYIAGSLDENGGVSVAPGLKVRPDRSGDRPLYE